MRVPVTGASRRLGRALVEELARRGHDVVAGARRVADLAGSGSAAVVVALDVTDPESVAAAVAAGPVDAVVNNAGVAVSGPVEAVPVDVAREVFETNVLGAPQVTQAFLPGMRERGGAAIVNVSSVAGRTAYPLSGVYAASKAALESLSEALRVEVRRFGVRVVVVEPGAIRTGMAAGQPRYSAEPYDPLVEQLEAGFRRYQEQGAGSPAELVASRIADVVEAPDPPRRVPLGARLGDAEWEQQTMGRLAW